MVLSYLDHSLLASILGAVKAKHVGRCRSIPQEVLGLDHVLREILNHNTRCGLLCQALDEIGGESIVILANKPILSYKRVEINELHVGSLSHGYTHGGLSAALWAQDAHALGQDGLLRLSVDLCDRASGVDVVHLAELFVVIDHWETLIEIVLHPRFDGLFVVIGTATCFGSLHAPLEHQFLWYVVEENLMRLNHILFEEDCLVDGSRKAVDEVGLGWRGYQSIDQNLNSELKWNQSTFFLNLLDFLSFFCSFSYLLSHQISSRDVLKAEFFHDFLALSSFA